MLLWAARDEELMSVLEQVLQRIAVCSLLASAVVIYLPASRPSSSQVRLDHCSISQLTSHHLPQKSWHPPIDYPRPVLPCRGRLRRRSHPAGRS